MYGDLIQFMQNRWEDIQAEVTARIYKEFITKYGGNKLRLAKDAGCDEKALRVLFEDGGNLSLKLLFKLAAALELQPCEILRDLSLNK